MTEFPTEPATSGTSAAATAPRPGVPVWRVGKPDAFLADATATALEAVRSLATGENIGTHVGVRSEGVRCVTHLFECKLPGYVGWQWFATLARVSRSKEATVNEVGMLPTNDSVLAPPWVPWAERVRPEDAKADEPEAPSGEHDDDHAHAEAPSDGTASDEHHGDEPNDD